MLRHDFGNYIKALRGQRPERIPLSEFWISHKVMAEILGCDLPVYDGTEDSLREFIRFKIEFADRMGYDFILVEYGVQAGESQAFANDFERLVSYEHGGLFSIREKFEGYQWFDEPKVDARALEMAGEMVPAGMKIITIISGLWDNAMMNMGMEDFCIALHDDIDYVNQYVDKFTEIGLAGFEKVRKTKNLAAVLSGGDIGYCGGLLISPEVCRSIFLPNYKRIIDKIHESGLYCIFHTDGNVSELIGDFIGIGVDGLHPVEPKAMDIRALRNRVGGRLCLIGNIDLDWPLTRGTPVDVRRETLGLLEDMAPYGAFCLGSSNSITDAVPAENYLAMIHAVHEFNGTAL